VITQYLPTLFDAYGGAPSASVDTNIADSERSLYLFYNQQLQILLVDATKPLGTELYNASTLNQAIPLERTGVPRLVIGDVVLVGSAEIPEQTGDLVRQGLDQGGIGWPSIDGLDEALKSIPAALPAAVATEVDSVAVVVESAEDSATAQMPVAVEDTVVQPAILPDTEATIVEESVAPAPTEVRETPPVDTVESNATAEPQSAVVPDTSSVFEAIQVRRPTMLENFRLDSVGNSFSVAVLLMMVVSIVAVCTRSRAVPISWGLGFGIPLLAAIGVVVASYLTYIEATGAIAVCGPVGDCNTVNQSDWARLFGVLPVGALGLMGYVAIALSWSASKYSSGSVSAWARLSLLAMTFGGTLFSIYLTFLEPFVIGATCAWCLTSSVIITTLMWLSAGSGRDAWVQIRDGRHR